MGKRKKHVPIKFPLRDGKLPAAAYSPAGYRYALVRIALPENDKRKQQRLPPLYYDADSTGPSPWVEKNYKKWRIDDWKNTYGEQYINDIRHWDFFGEEINIWEGYSDE
jgi:hypothetical protein